jgi:FkbM family methyltransferase
MAESNRYSAMYSLIERLLIKYGVMRQARAVWDVVYLYTNKKRNRDNALRGLLRPFIPESGLVFDVGANIGNYSDLFLTMGARVVAFEPNPTLVRRLNKRFGHNRNITVEPVALGDGAYSTFMYSCESHGLSSLSDKHVREAKQIFHTYNWKPNVLVRVKLLSDYIKQYGVPDFVKIDVEGYELNVLQGMNMAVPALSFEFLRCDPYTTTQCLSVLDSLGDYEYRYTIGLEPDMQYLCDWTSSSEIMTFIANQDNYEFGDIWARTKRQK